MKIRVDLYPQDLVMLADKLEELSSVSIGFSEGAEHYSGRSMADLVRLLSRGFTTAAPKSGRPVRVPPRPFIKQFVEFGEQAVRDMVRAEFHHFVFGGCAGGIQQVWESVGGAVAAMMSSFALSGGVTPGNTPYTVKRKGVNKPYVDHSDLVNSIKYRLPV